MKVAYFEVTWNRGGGGGGTRSLPSPGYATTLSHKTTFLTHQKVEMQRGLVEWLKS